MTLDSTKSPKAKDPPKEMQQIFKLKFGHVEQHRRFQFQDFSYQIILKANSFKGIPEIWDRHEVTMTL